MNLKDVTANWFAERPFEDGTWKKREITSRDVAIVNDNNFRTSLYSWQSELLARKERKASSAYLRGRDCQSLLIIASFMEFLLKFLRY